MLLKQKTYIALRARHLSTYVAAALAIQGSPALADNTQSAMEDIPDGARIGSVTIDRQNIFDLSDSKEDNKLYSLINRLHIPTRHATIQEQLLFEPGEVFNPRVIAETERILRANKYFYDASVTPRLNAAGEVDVTVATRDLWTLTPEITLSRSGGENKTEFGIEESNLFGLGQRIVIARADDVDRTSTTFEFADRQLGGTWIGLNLLLADNSDGHSNRVAVVKPFHSLDARNAGGITWWDDDRRSTYYELGEEAAEYSHKRRQLQSFGGWSRGLQNGWVRRWTTGAVFDEHIFTEVAEPELPQVLPDNRKLVYPFVGYEILEDRYVKSSNSNQIERAEDFYLGTRLSMTLGWSNEHFGADRDAIIYRLTANHSFGSLDKKALLLAGFVAGRQEKDGVANSVVDLNASFYWRQSEKRLFFTNAALLLGHNLDRDKPVELGGDEGLRGFPLRYQSGDSRFVMSIEQRYFTDWYPFRLFRVGGALFVDVGRVWGSNALNSDNLGWLSNAGFGLRFAPTRLGTKKVFHLDIAFPINGESDIDSVQVLFKAKNSF